MNFNLPHIHVCKSQKDTHIPIHKWIHGRYSLHYAKLEHERTVVQQKINIHDDKPGLSFFRWVL